MQTGLWVWALEDDDEFRLDYANEASGAAIGLEIGEVLGRTMRAVLPALSEDAIERFRAVVNDQTLYDAGEVEYGDERIAPSVFSVKAFPLAGRRVAVTFENVTENVRARRALQESESRFRGAFHSASVGMALAGLDGTFVQVNDRLAKMLGYTVEEITRLGVRGITHPDDLAIDSEPSEKLRSGEIDSYQREKRYIRKDGSIVWADLTVSLARTYEGEPTHVVAHIQDVTDRSSRRGSSQRSSSIRSSRSSSPTTSAVWSM